MIDYRYEVFIVVASKLSFSKASQDLFISQPAISKHIKQLEDELGLPLFERKGNSISLTLSGKNLFEKLQKAKLIQKEIQSDFSSGRHNLAIKEELKIGASTTISLYVLPKIFAYFHKKYPNAKILLINRNSENILKSLLQYDVDIALIEHVQGLNSVTCSLFMEDEIIPVCSKNSPYRYTLLDKTTIEQLPLALRENGSGTLKVVTDTFDKLRIKIADLNIIARLGGTEALKNYLLEGEAVGFLSKLAIQKELDSGDLIAIQSAFSNIKRTFYFVNRKGEETIGLTKELIKFSMDQYN